MVGADMNTTLTFKFQSQDTTFVDLTTTTRREAAWSRSWLLLLLILWTQRQSVRKARASRKLPRSMVASLHRPAVVLVTEAPERMVHVRGSVAATSRGTYERALALRPPPEMDLPSTPVCNGKTALICISTHTLGSRDLGPPSVLALRRGNIGSSITTSLADCADEVDALPGQRV
jgi:hypothetical protein